MTCCRPHWLGKGDMVAGGQQEEEEVLGVMSATQILVGEGARGFTQGSRCFCYSFYFFFYSYI